MTRFILPYRPFGFWILLLGVLSMISCEEQLDWNLNTLETNTIVVDARLTNEFKYQHIHISLPFSNQNENGNPSVSGANVWIETANNSMSFLESTEFPGHYFSQEKISTAIDVNYTLFIQYDEKEYQAETYMVPVLPSGYPQWVYNSDNGLYFIQWPAGPYNPAQQAMYEAIISWEHLLDSTYSDTIASARLMYYTFTTLDVSYVIFPQEKEKVFFPANSIAIVKKYSLTDEYASYLRALLAETEWQGSLFEDARGNLPTNISNGGLGYFSASSVLSDTLIVN